MTRKIILKDKTEQSFEIDSPDLPEFNKELLKKNFSDIDSFEVFSKGYNVKVDLINGEIIVDGNSYDLEIDDSTKNKLKDLELKWINFRRNTVSYRMDGLKAKKTEYGIGFQTTIDGKNFKRFILVDRNKISLNKE